MHADGKLCAYPCAFFHNPLSLFYKQRARSSAAQRDAGEVMHMHWEICVQLFECVICIFSNRIRPHSLLTLRELKRGVFF
jgi:hypothetical protein